MSTPMPTTPDHAAPRKAAGLNRSFTLPSKFAPTRPHATPEIGATEGLETLCFHPNVKVLKFSISSSPRPSSANTRTSSPGGQLGHGTLPWASSSEQTVAAGPLEIYRVPGSVSFLRSGSLLHAIMPRSQCWCVDGVSKFAMRVLNDTYYRIELPGDTPEDLERVEELKSTFTKVLHYERTPCPFARTFTVELPEEAPIKKKRRKAHGPAKRWRLEKAYSWKPEDGGEPPVEEEEIGEDSGSITESDGEDGDSPGEGEDSPVEDTELSDKVRDLSFSTPSRPTVRDRVRDFSTRRSFTAPVQAAMQATPPSRLRTSVAVAPLIEEETGNKPAFAARTPENTSVRMFQAIPTDMPPSPPDSSAGFELAEATAPFHSIREMSSIETQAEPFTPDRRPMQPVFAENEEASQDSTDTLGVDAKVQADNGEDTVVSEPRTPSPVEAEVVGPPGVRDKLNDENLLSDRHGHVDTLASTDVNSPIAAGGDDPDPFAQIQARIQARRSIGGASDPRLGSYSPYHTPSKSLSPRRPPTLHRNSHHQQALTAAIVNKACEVFLGPPAHLVRIMLRIAARLANGTLGRNLFTSPAGESTRVPGTFNLDGSDVEDLDSDDDVEEDDFGVPLRSPIRLAARADAICRSISGGTSESSTRERRTWEVD